MLIDLFFLLLLLKFWKELFNNLFCYYGCSDK